MLMPGVRQKVYTVGASAVITNGDVVGSFQLIRPIGRGAMGEVWLGRHQVTGTLGAVKRLHAAGRAHTEWFEREARAVARLQHPHIIPLFEVGPGYLVTAFIDGGSLARRVQSAVPPAEVVRIARYVADALAHAHERGVIHGDVKPANILLDRLGRPFLADFGLASLLDEGLVEGRVAGTPAFMAPEQRRGEITPAIDQYALGRTLIEMLVGGDIPLDRDRALAELPATLPRPLREVIARATAIAPGDRFASMAELERALATIEVGDLALPRRLAGPLRAAKPFAWAAHAHRVVADGPGIERADYRLTELAGRGLPEREVRELLARAGLAELGFSAWGSTERLGPIASPAVLAAAGDVVILLHAWGYTRMVWSAVARSLVRDNARAVVLAPDVHGFGETTFKTKPTREQATIDSMMRMIDEWRRLLGLAAIPTALVGHSMSGLGVVLIGDTAAGLHVSRVAINPFLLHYDPTSYRKAKTVAMLTRAIGWIPFVFRAGVAKTYREAVKIHNINPASAREACANTLRLTQPVVAALLDGLVRSTRRVEPQQRLAVIAGTNDPLMSDESLDRMIEEAGLQAANVFRLPDGGHHPHVERADKPEWSARNIADIVRIIDSMLITAGGSGTMSSDSTAHGSTALPDATVGR
jgi:serine/threonine protein kinase